MVYQQEAVIMIVFQYPCYSKTLERVTFFSLVASDSQVVELLNLKARRFVHFVIKALNLVHNFYIL